MQISAILKGLDKTLSRLAEIKTLEHQAELLAVERACLLMRDTAVSYAGAGHPEHPEVQTGRLRSSLRYLVEDGVPVKGYVGSDSDYASFVEFGHMQVMAWGHPMEPKPVKPYPFFRPAIADVFDSGTADTLMTNTFKEVLKV